jgi:hypothetical protein
MNIGQTIYEASLKDIPVREGVVHGVNVQAQNPMADDKLLSYSALTPPKDIFAMDYYKASRDKHNKALASIYESDFISNPAIVLSEENIDSDYKDFSSRVEGLAEYRRLRSEGLNDERNLDGVPYFITSVVKYLEEDKTALHYSKYKEASSVISLGKHENDFSTDMFGENNVAELIKGNMTPENYQQFVLHHEYAHAISYKEYQDKYEVASLHNKSFYESYLEENNADTHAAMVMIKQGADKEILDSLTAWRTLRAVYNKDTDHFTGHSLQGIKGELSEEDIRNMDIGDITEYAKNSVKRNAMSEGEYYSFVATINGGRRTVIRSDEDGNVIKETDPSLQEVLSSARKELEGVHKYAQNTTPLEAEKILETVEISEEHDYRKFIEDFYVPIKDVAVFACDFESGLTKHPVAQEIYRNSVKEYFDEEDELWDENKDLDINLSEWDR